MQLTTNDYQNFFTVVNNGKSVNYQKKEYEVVFQDDPVSPLMVKTISIQHIADPAVSVFKLVALEGDNYATSSVIVNGSAYTINYASQGTIDSSYATIESLLTEVFQSTGIATLSNIIAYDSLCYLSVTLARSPSEFLVSLSLIEQSGSLAISQVNWGDGVVDVTTDHTYFKVEGRHNILVTLDNGLVFAFIVSANGTKLGVSQFNVFTLVDGNVTYFEYLKWYSTYNSYISPLGSTKIDNSSTYFPYALDSEVRPYVGIDIDTKIGYNNIYLETIPAMDSVLFGANRYHKVSVTGASFTVTIGGVTTTTLTYWESEADEKINQAITVNATTEATFKGIY